MRKAVQSVLLMLVVLLSSCGDVVDCEYNSHRNFFTFHNETHQGPVLASAMNPLSPGVYYAIGTNVVSGHYCFLFENNQELKSNAPVWFGGINLRPEGWEHVGLNNGLITGYGNLGSPSPFYACDLQRSNCFNTNTLPLRSYELKISNDGFGTCSNCHRKYNLNTGGNIASGDSSRKLIRYRAGNMDPYGALGINRGSQPDWIGRFNRHNKTNK